MNNDKRRIECAMNSVSFQIVGHAGHVVVNRLDSEFAICLSSCDAILSTLDRWRLDPSIRIVLIEFVDIGTEKIPPII